MEPTAKRAPRPLARKTNTERGRKLAARYNQYSCSELSAAMDLPLTRLEEVRDYGDLAYHMDLPRSRKG